MILYSHYQTHLSTQKSERGGGEEGMAHNLREKNAIIDATWGN